MKMIEIISKKLNVLFNGDKNHTLCYSVYKNQKSSIICKVWYKLINFCCFWERNHCRKVFLMENRKDKI